MSLFFLRGWILISAWATLTGWSLGLTGHLNTKGYLASLALLVIALIFLFFKRPFPCKFCGSYVHLLFVRSNKRFFRLQSFLFWFPGLFAFIALLALVGGILYSPSNYDALSYRIPRILHWLDISKWHWINTSNPRQNYSATGFEWLMAPLLVFFRTDRFFFLINWISFLLMPGLIFRTFSIAGIQGKVAWFWMWLLPLGYGYALQSGSIANDSFASVYALASVCFVLSADNRAHFSDFGWSILSVALLTGTKGSNLPLALPWMLAMLIRYKFWMPRYLSLLPFVFLGLIVSFLPIATLNQKYTGSWTGDPGNQTKVALNNPVAGIIGNSLMLAYTAAQPPALIGSSHLDNAITFLLPVELQAWLFERFPRFELKMGEIPVEESAGLGFGLLGCLILWILHRRQLAAPTRKIWKEPWFLLGMTGLFSILFYMTKMGSESAARLLLPYYPFLFLLFLGFGRAPDLPKKRMRWLLLFLSSFVLIPLILNPARPLLPIRWLLDANASKLQLERVRLVYDTYARRSDCFSSFLDALPPEIETLGFFSHEDDLEAPLWRPFGARKIICINQKLDCVGPLPMVDAWLVRRSIAEVLSSHPHWCLDWKEFESRLIMQKVSIGPEEWVLFLRR